MPLIKEKKITDYWKTLNWFSLLLYPLSLLYCFIIWLRRKLYQNKILKVNQFKTPLIVVGNISVGGNGKTPLIIELIEALKKNNYHPGVVSRGYGASNSLLEQGSSILVDTSQPATLFGDEPWMIANKTNCPVVIAHERSKAVDYLQKNSQCDVILSDDGLQHYAMSRDIEICVVDTSKLFGNKLCIPAGPLREPSFRLKDFDFIVYHRTINDKYRPINNSNNNYLEECSLYMQLVFDQVYPVESLLFEQDSLQQQQQQQKKSIQDFKSLTIHAVAGISSPHKFFDQLRDSGINVIEHAFNDHHQFIEKDFVFNDDLVILMTEKDAVKCRTFNLKNTFYVTVKATLSKDVVGSIIERLTNNLKRK